MEHTMPRGRALVVSTSFMLRASYAAALELDGWLALEACSTDEVLWCLVAARMGEASDDDEALRAARRLDAEVVDLLAPPEAIAARIIPRRAPAAAR